MVERLDIIIFGASGFTGKFTIPAVERLTKENGRNLTWGIAGRSKSKLKSALTEISKKIGKDLTSVPIILADVKDEESLQNMTKQAKIILNTCGPYRFFGEPVIKACIETGTHHVDVSGEPHYMENMQLLYHEAAMSKGIYIVSACGFDSIPTDLGVVFMQKNFEGTLNSVEMYLAGKEEGIRSPGPSFNYATWESAIHGFANYNDLIEVRSKLFPQRLPKFTPTIKTKNEVHKNKVTNSWTLPFPGSDRSVVQRSQRYFYELEHKRPLQINTYFCMDSYFYIYIISICGLIFSKLTTSSFGRKLLLRYPRIFSWGYFSHCAPSEEKLRKVTFSITMKGEGWSEKQENCNIEYITPPDKQIMVKISGKNPAYGLTGVILTIAAIKILEESSSMPNNGGVYPPGAAFAHTTIIEELNQNGLKFEIPVTSKL